MADLLEILSAERPALGVWLDSLSDFFQSLPGLRQRMVEGFAQADVGRLKSSLEELVEKGALPKVDPRDQSQISALWRSYFFTVFLSSIGFYPPDGANPLDEVLPPCAAGPALASRVQEVEKLFPGIDFWQWCLKKTFCERFLDPFLPEGPLQGLDLACGWGRATFGLRFYENRLIHCCDHHRPNLDLLEQLAERAGIRACLKIHHCGLEQLPFEDDSLDFAIAFDIFELLTDETLDRCLTELLRCHRVGAPLYCKVTMRAFRPCLGQVQNFTPPRAALRFRETKAHGKTFKMRHVSSFLPEHLTFQVVSTS